MDKPKFTLQELDKLANEGNQVLIGQNELGGDYLLTNCSSLKKVWKFLRNNYDWTEDIKNCDTCRHKKDIKDFRLPKKEIVGYESTRDGEQKPIYDIKENCSICARCHSYPIKFVCDNWKDKNE